MKVTELAVPGVIQIEPKVFGDDRGFFLETFHSERYAAAGIPTVFVQDNLSSSQRGVLRGLHFQHPHPQGKLVSVLAGRALDVVVDLRPGSETFGGHVAVELDGKSKRQLWVPEGFAHGFLTLEDDTVFAYKCTAPYAPEYEHSLRYDDPALGIDWPKLDYQLSAKDRAGRDLSVIRKLVSG